MSDQPTDTPQKADPTKVAKYRAWMSAGALFAAAIFGILAVGSFTAGEGLADDIETGSGLRVIVTFAVIGVVMFGFTAAALVLAWRFRPGGD